MLLDAAKVMEEEYRVEYRKALRRGEPEKVKPPLLMKMMFMRLWSISGYSLSTTSL